MSNPIEMRPVWIETQSPDDLVKRMHELHRKSRSDERPDEDDEQ